MVKPTGATRGSFFVAFSINRVCERKKKVVYNKKQFICRLTCSIQAAYARVGWEWRSKISPQIEQSLQVILSLHYSQHENDSSMTRATHEQAHKHALRLLRIKLECSQNCDKGNWGTWESIEVDCPFFNRAFAVTFHYKDFSFSSQLNTFVSTLRRFNHSRFVSWSNLKSFCFEDFEPESVDNAKSQGHNIKF